MMDACGITFGQVPYCEANRLAASRHGSNQTTSDRIRVAQVSASRSASTRSVASASQCPPQRRSSGDHG
jgi:hypothetical protein